ncbi:hypothetical protein RCL1_004951 [Eukaryota sp. TZLM3-RCL]
MTSSSTLCRSFVNSSFVYPANLLSSLTIPEENLVYFCTKDSLLSYQNNSIIFFHSFEKQLTNALLIKSPSIKLFGLFLLLTDSKLYSFPKSCFKLVEINHSFSTILSVIPVFSSSLPPLFIFLTHSHSFFTISAHLFDHFSIKVGDVLFKSSFISKNRPFILSFGSNLAVSADNLLYFYSLNTMELINSINFDSFFIIDMSLHDSELFLLTSNNISANGCFLKIKIPVRIDLISLQDFETITLESPINFDWITSSSFFLSSTCDSFVLFPNELIFNQIFPLKNSNLLCIHNSGKLLVNSNNTLIPIITKYCFPEVLHISNLLVINSFVFNYLSGIYLFVFGILNGENLLLIFRIDQSFGKLPSIFVENFDFPIISVMSIKSENFDFLIVSSCIKVLSVSMTDTDFQLKTTTLSDQSIDFDCRHSIQSFVVDGANYLLLLNKDSNFLACYKYFNQYLTTVPIRMPKFQSKILNFTLFSESSTLLLSLNSNELISFELNLQDELNLTQVKSIKFDCRLDLIGSTSSLAVFNFHFNQSVVIVDTDLFFFPAFLPCRCHFISYSKELIFFSFSSNFIYFYEFNSSLKKSVNFELSNQKGIMMSRDCSSSIKFGQLLSFIFGCGQDWSLSLISTDPFLTSLPKISIEPPSTTCHLIGHNVSSEILSILIEIEPLSFIIGSYDLSLTFLDQTRHHMEPIRFDWFKLPTSILQPFLAKGFLLYFKDSFINVLKFCDNKSWQLVGNFQTNISDPTKIEFQSKLIDDVLVVVLVEHNSCNVITFSNFSNIDMKFSDISSVSKNFVNQVNLIQNFYSDGLFFLLRTTNNFTLFSMDLKFERKFPHASSFISFTFVNDQLSAIKSDGTELIIEPFD